MEVSTLRSSYKIDISIIIINWNSGNLLKRCLSSLVQYTTNISFEVFVIDNDSRDDSYKNAKEAFSTHKSFTWIENGENLGCVAYNRVLSICRGRHIALIEPDIEFVSPAIKRMVEFLDKNVDAGAVTAKLMNPDRSPQNYYYRFWNLPMFFFNTKIGHIFDYAVFRGRFSRRYFGDNIDSTKLTIVEQPGLVCFMFRRDAISDNYIVDGELSFYFPDVDLCKRIYKNSYKIYLLPSAEVFHYKSYCYNQADEDWKHREFCSGAIKYFKKYHKTKVIPLRIMFLFIDISLLIYKLLPKNLSRQVRKFYWHRDNTFKND